MNKKRPRPGPADPEQDILKLLKQLLKEMKTMAAGQAELRDMVQKLKAALAKAQAEIQSDVDALKAKIDAGMAGPDLTPELTELQSTVDALDQLDPDPTNPPPAPPQA